MKANAREAKDRRAQPALALAAPIATVSLVGIGLSLSMALLSVRLAKAGYSAHAIGLNPAAGGVATLAIAPFVPQLARHLGVRRLLFVSLLACALSLAGFAAFEDYWTWLVIRAGFGACLTVLFALSEFWINTIAPHHRRGVILGLYTTSLAAGFAIGPAILTFTGTAGLTPFLAAIALFAAATAPVALIGGQAPELERQAHMSLRRFVAAAPVATLAALIYGAIETAAMGLLPVYALRNGMSAETGALLVSLFAIGNILLPIPMGLLSDRFDRRWLLLCVAAVSGLGAVLLPLAVQDFSLFAVLLVVWGGVVGSLYAIGLAYLGTRYRGAELASANAAYIMLYSAGMLIGPPILGAGLDLAPAGLFIALGLMLAAYAGMAAWHLRCVDP